MSMINRTISKNLVETWALEVFESWGSKQWPGPWRARGARAYNGGLGAQPPAGSRGRAPGGGESFLVLERPERQNSKMSKSIRLSLTSQCRRLKLLGKQELWPAFPCQKLKEQLLPLLPLFQRPRVETVKLQPCPEHTSHDDDNTIAL